MHKLLREPLIYFLLAGAGIFALGGIFPDDGDDYTIVVSDAEYDRIKDQWQAQMGRTPTDEELGGLVEQWIREEIYYREAIRMGLDRDDIIIRRRLAQKLTFLTEDLAAGATPSPTALQNFFTANAERYTVPDRVSFRHRYFSTDRRADAQADAVAAIAAAGVADDSITGDPFMLQLDYAQRSEREIADLFGSEFASALRQLPTGDWQGPIRSAYGWHAVTIEQRYASHLPAFDTVARKVAIDHKQDLRRVANERYFEALSSRYEIIGS